MIDDNKELSTFISYILGMGLPFLIIHKIRAVKDFSVYSLDTKNSKSFIWLAIIAIAIQLGITGPIIWSIPMPEFVQRIFLELGNQKGLFAFLTIVIAAPILEELIFRGIMLDGLLKRYTPLKSILISSVFFGIIHLNPWQFVAAFLIGIFAGWVYYRTREIALSILIHMTNNLFAFGWNYISDPADFLNISIVDIYGGIVNALLVITGSIVIIVLGINSLNKSLVDDLQTETVSDLIES
jgi:membrane protease YdiL (CAAX protease family)